LQAGHTDAPTILLIEDDPAISDLLVEYLSGEGYVVTAVADGTAALGALAQQSFALIVTDALAEQRSPAERWIPLEEIRRAARGVPIIICTAYRAGEYAEYATRGFSALLTKPFDLGALLALIVHTLYHAAPEGRGKRRDAF